MTERQIYDGLVVDGTADFVLVADTLRHLGVAWCVIDNFAVNAYAAPVYTADIDLVLASADLIVVLRSLEAVGFKVKAFASSTKIRRRFGQTAQGTYPLTISLRTADCYWSFLARATTQLVLGQAVPVAALKDVVQGERWNLADPDRRPSERAKDRFDLVKLAEKRFDEVVPLLPDELRAAAEADRRRRLETGDNGWGDDDWGEP